jgi:peptidoglycan/LPS O-acetylase OafA/YrhL
VIVKAIVFIVGLSDLFVGVILMVAPRWFYDHFGTFPPYSRHFLGDTGAFILAIGVALVVAGTNPAKYRSLVTIGAIASVLHLLNHLYGSLFTHEPWLPTIEVAVPAVAMVGVVIYLRSSRSGLSGLER